MIQCLTSSVMTMSILWLRNYSFWSLIDFEDESPVNSFYHMLFRKINTTLIYQVGLSRESRKHHARSITEYFKGFPPISLDHLVVIR